MAHDYSLEFIIYKKSLAGLSAGIRMLQQPTRARSWHDITSKQSTHYEKVSWKHDYTTEITTRMFLLRARFPFPLDTS